jgi:thiol-disulfide isomerase/thioredoxin
MPIRTAIPILGLIFLSPAGTLALDDPGHPSSGEPAALHLVDLEGREKDIQDFQGGIVVVNFWATWCVPCREEMPILVSLQRRYARRGVRFLAVSTDNLENRPAVARFAQEMALNFPVWVGATTREMRRWGLGEALPATAVLDPEGRIAHRILGPVTRGDLKKRIDWLLSAPPPLLDRFPEAEGRHAHSHRQESGRKGAEASGPEADGRGGDSHHEENEEDHQHGGVGVEGASLVPS